MTLLSTLPRPRFRMPRFLTRRVTTMVAAGAVAVAGLSATARPAEADADDLLRFLAGAIVVGAIVNAIDDNHTPHYYSPRVLPGSCMETIRVNGRNIQSFNERCLNRAGYGGLPQHCRYEFRVNYGRTRTGYIAECLYESGYNVGNGGWENGGGWNNGGHGGYRPPISARPPRVDPPYMSPPRHNASLPGHCSMTYRQQGQRVNGYWAGCLRDAGVRNLPGYCRVTSTGGDRIFNANCLRDAGYRTR
ncbi:hypothetical protein LCM17_09575 [Cereibacter sphaeroides]|nr:hypothetical protein [Cereibacter sphaeroides]